MSNQAGISNQADILNQADIMNPADILNRSEPATILTNTGYTLVTENSCTTMLLHISGPMTTTAMDTGYVFFRAMHLDTIGADTYITATMTSGTVLTEGIMLYADHRSEQCSQRR